MDRKIRILYELPPGGIGGTEKFMLSLCRNHDKSWFEIVVCIMLPFTGYTVADEIAANGHKFARPNMKNGFYIILQEFAERIRMLLESPELARRMGQSKFERVS